MVGIGPGDPAERTRRAEDVIIQSDVVVGYKLYLDLVKDITVNKEIISSGMTKEVERCAEAVGRAVSGRKVALLSSGDPGIYGMAGLAIEIASSEKVDIEIVAGVSAASAAAARLGAPLMNDFACISLSDLLVPWEQIRNRIEKATEADFVLVIYNPKSFRRTRQIKEATEIIRKYRPFNTPVGICTAVGTDRERITITNLGKLLDEEINMRSVVIVGNSTSKIINGRLVTPRGYKV